MKAGPAQEPEYAELIAALAAFRKDRLKRMPSDRTLAGAVGVSPTTIGNWLVKGQFPQEIDPLLVVVRAVQIQAERAGLIGDPEAAAVLDVNTWRRVYQSEARRRADGTSAAVQAGQGQAVLERMRPGRPLSEVVDPFYLEVHQAIGSPVAGLPVLPPYVEREHDHQLREEVEQAADGSSRIAVLVGDSATGKTRACWEALQSLRGRDEPWRLWHPIDPTRPDAALAELSGIGPYTVIWLNEAQFYLEPDPLGEQVAAGLRAVLRDWQRAPLLVLATLWAEHWNTLTTRTTGDRHAQVRELLDGHRIRVPGAFTGNTLAALTYANGTDPRLVEAAAHAVDGQVTQYLAGGPVLMSRYEDAVPATKALIHAAMDARRLGAGPHIPLAWLTEAAPGYLTESQWNHSGNDWLEQALSYVTQPCNGIPGILTPVKAGNPRNQRTSTHAATAVGQRAQTGQGPLYRLADYLDQHGRHHRAETIPPIDFWTAAAAYAHPVDLTALAVAARNRGLYRDAAQLHKLATTHGNPRAALALVNLFHPLHPTDHHPVRWAAAHVPVDNPFAVVMLLEELRKAGAVEQVAALAERAAAHIPLDDQFAVVMLLEELRKAGAVEQVAALAERAAAHVPLDDQFDVARLLGELRRAGAGDQVAVLLARDPAAHVPLGDPFAVARLLKELRRAGAVEQVVVLAERAAAQAPLDNPSVVTELLEVLRRAGAVEQVVVLAERAAAQVPLDNPSVVARLLGELRRAGVGDQVAVLLARDPAAHVSLGDLFAVARLLKELRRAGAVEQVVVLAERAAAQAPLDNPSVVIELLGELWRAGVGDQVAVLLARDPAARVSLGDPFAVARLLEGLRRVGAGDQVAVLLARDPAAQAPLDNPSVVTELLEGLRRVGAMEQAAALAERAAAQAPLGNPSVVAQLLNGLRRAGRMEQAAALAERAAAQVPLDNPSVVARLLGELRRAGVGDQVAVLLARDPAAHVSLDNPSAVTELLGELWGAGDQVAVLLARDPAAHVSLDNPSAVIELLGVLRRRAGGMEQAAALAERAAAQAPLDNPSVVIELLGELWGAGDQVAVLLARDPAAHVSLDNPSAVIELLGVLRRRAGGMEQAAALAERAGAQVPLDRPSVVTELLEGLWRAGAREQAAVLAERAAARAPLDNPFDVARLLEALRRAGAMEQATTLAERLTALGRFDPFIEIGDHRELFAFGREPDGRPAAPWSWEDLR
ncbi:hypothetical protein [Streptomyces sp. NPDC001642]|uniref:hypothetical protein n=1 Tax=Streptomyces sp. NPDC001642 TaxID=3154392 RepID=UPI00332DC60F